MTTRAEEVLVCHVGLCAVHLHCCSSSSVLTFRPVLYFQTRRKRPSIVPVAVVSHRHARPPRMLSMLLSLQYMVGF
ncbi:hypothetical protein XENORESO_003582 [Xenotaenia resolanae]|uniref:Secreted protein n=1 Tax=Xenotaenia resolanae TaxID=208358 RepID=A0ABV0VQ82_9TELE